MADVQPPQDPAPTTPEEVAAIEEKWLREVYKGDSLPELTLQVVVISIFLGFLMISFNIYMGLKTGWGEGGSIIAVILGYAVMKALGRKYSILENNATQTFASAAGSLGNIVNVIPALILLAEAGVIERGPTFMEVLLWVFFTSFLGVFFAIPLRRQMLVVDQLVFPTGTAAAQTIQAMHATGEDAMGKAKMLGGVGLVSALVTLVQNFLHWLPHAVAWPFTKIKLGGITLSKLTFATAISPMMFGAGFLVGPRVGTSLLIGGFAAFGIMAPQVINAGIAQDIAMNLVRPDNLEFCTGMFNGSVPMDEAAFGAKCKSLAQLNAGAYYSLVVKWTMWPGLGIMVASGLTATLMKWRIVLAALKSIVSPTGGKSPIAHLEFPTKWWVSGLILSSIGVCGMLQMSFGVPWYFGLLAVALSFILAVIAVRATGETDINPVGAMGSVTQIAFGTLQSATGAGAASLGAITTGNLLTGGVAAGGASEAADMMQDLKTGWLVGATPRKQVYAQLMGVLIGSVFCAAIFWVLIQGAPIGSERWPAPAAITWSGLAQMMAQGASALPRGAMQALAVGIAIGIAIPLIQLKAPESVNRWMPSAVGLGVAMVVPYQYCVSIFLGSMLFLAIKKKNPAWILAYAGAIGAGGIAGEGLAGVFHATWEAAPTVWSMISAG
jgi:OPT family oligopeptide transporter